jgi:ribose transport system permease protein/erythritol transport system permease protein
MTAPPATEPPAAVRGAQDEENDSLRARAVRAVLTQRIGLLAVLLVVLVAILFYLSSANYLTAPYNAKYMASSLIDAVPLTMLALAELLVIVSGRGGIDLSVGSIVSVAGMVFGFGFGEWHLPLALGILVAVLVGAVLGAINGALVAYLGFPALIATLATYYAYGSIAIVMNHQQPISTGPIQQLYSITTNVSIPGLGGVLPSIPLGIFTFLIPLLVAMWFLLRRSTYGRRLFAVGTNDVAAWWSGLGVAATRMITYTLAGAISGLAAVYYTAEFASARPDAGDAGNGLALPAITIAVLGGVAITGGIGRLAGVVLAAVLITWLDAGILLYFTGDTGTQVQLAALGLVLLAAALLNGVTSYRYGGER